MNSDYYISLIYKELKGVISPEETKDLRAWEKQSSENQLTSEEVRQVWIESEHYELPFKLDHDVDFNKMKSTITTSPTPAKVVPMRPRILWLQAIAAAVIVLLGATFLFQNYFENDAEWVVVKESNEVQEIQLADGSKAWLNAGSTLSYPAEFPATERPIKLNGEAFFEVSKDANRPFQVTTNRTTVTVLGTEFNVRDMAEEKTFEVAVQEGKVQVQKNESTQKIILVRNEKAVYDEKNDSLEKVVDQNLNATAWKSKSLKFRDNTLDEVISAITRQASNSLYIRLENDKMKKCRISGRYSTDTDIMVLLKDITSIHNMQVKQIDHRGWKISGGSCD
ncbi:MAG: FecR family protein [Saprospiraceae bacterium]